mmetsp:Transcript_4759/g.14332  ORF Transcript_4759/g.14332 Transcript_4759/m.14332 type:complete len:308 (+) Transcript_4759:1-924(+)
MERPGFTRTKLVEHEADLDAWRFYEKQRKYILRAAHNEWAEFQEYATGTLRKATELRMQQISADQKREKFDRLRLQLRERLLRWKRDKLEAAREQERTEMAEKRALVEWEKHEAARVEQERRVLREKLKVYHEERDRATARKREQEALAAKLQAAYAAEEAAANAARVDYRRAIEDTKTQEIVLKRQHKAEIEIERERRLDRLRAQVQVTATIDRARARGHTAASTAAATSGVARRNDIAARRCDSRSFEPYGYTKDVLDKDKRTRVEMALRAQGLLDTDYAREVLRKVPPPTAPRRDLESSLFKDT